MPKHFDSEYYCFGTKYNNEDVKLTYGNPLTKMWRAQKITAKAIKKQRWDITAKGLIKLIDYIDEVVNWKQIDYGKPHLDGIYRFGSMEIERAPKKIKGLIENFNQKLLAARSSLGR